MSHLYIKSNVSCSLLTSQCYVQLISFFKKICERLSVFVIYPQEAVSECANTESLGGLIIYINYLNS